MTDAELIARLRGVTIKQHAYGAYTLVPDPLSSSAADRIEALVAAGRAYREATRHLKPCPETSAGFDAALK